MLKRLLLGLLVLWSGLSLLAEARRAVTSWDDRGEWRSRPDNWRFGTPQVAALEACFAAARRLVPPGSLVAFATPPEPPDTALLPVRWAAYLMPAQDVLARDDAAATAAQYVVAWGAPLQDPGLTGIRQLPGCVLYRVNRP
ncbi:MAG TPA: hypothetical protein VIA62_19535 [Thermoanaerobaculia bacterium]|jgi:hypothetical protein|nr:hypothetical protein [Thermoanaerobaculia bacterium]